MKPSKDLDKTISSSKEASQIENKTSNLSGNRNEARNEIELSSVVVIGGNQQEKKSSKSCQGQDSHSKVPHVKSLASNSISTTYAEASENSVNQSKEMHSQIETKVTSVDDSHDNKPGNLYSTTAKIPFEWNHGKSNSAHLLHTTPSYMWQYNYENRVKEGPWK